MFCLLTLHWLHTIDEKYKYFLLYHFGRFFGRRFVMIDPDPSRSGVRYSSISVSQKWNPRYGITLCHLLHCYSVPTFTNWWPRRHTTVTLFWTRSLGYERAVSIVSGTSDWLRINPSSHRTDNCWRNSWIDHHLLLLSKNDVWKLLIAF